MDTRREFIKKAALLSGAAGVLNFLPVSIQKAFAIDPKTGSTWLDAEHIVILMQENRSFDHCFGTLQGVRGFNDPRAITLPNKNKVWLQENTAGETYAPFRLDIKNSKATWIGSLPHSWANQVDARNAGKYNKWLDSKKSGNKEYAHFPLTMGYYTREDVPFNYAMADAFTLCDQNFCSSLTGTTPNRLFLWTGTIRQEQHADSPAKVWNENVDYDRPASWTSFPERLEDNGISWKIYQNEISVGVGLTGEEDAWLANFGDNPLEWFSQYNVKFSPAYMRYIPKKIELLKEEIKKLEETIPTLPEGEKLNESKKELEQKKKELVITLDDQIKYTPENYSKLSQREKNLHEKAFCTNTHDPFQHELDSLKYDDGSEVREMQVPKGDVFHQFRKDVKEGNLPIVSWLVAPENFSDHPSAPWYGAWYVSETMDILTQNPEVWKKTIFILCYDENDGDFDHVPPFVVPDPYKPGSGMVSKEIDTRVDYVTLEQDKKANPGHPLRESSIGLGYRVPLLIASPWSRGGYVNSQVFDHTSIIQLLEKFTSHKAGKEIKETNISDWRRTVCGDLSSVFRPWNNEKINTPAFLSKDHVLESIHKAKFKKDPSGFKNLSKEDIEQINNNPLSHLLPKQEKGVRPACALPYELYADGNLNQDKNIFEIAFKAGSKLVRNETVGSPFTVYAPGKHSSLIQKNEAAIMYDEARNWSYTVMAGGQLKDEWQLSEFENKNYHLAVHGPNGFFREFKGGSNDPDLNVGCLYEYNKQYKKFTGNISLAFQVPGSHKYAIYIKDNIYKNPIKTINIAGVGTGPVPEVVLDLKKSFGWYDFTISVQGAAGFEKRYAGHIETGKESFTDPAMGNI